MDNKLVCADEAEDFINDLKSFINGPQDQNVVLSDSSIIESYRKYAISDMTRTGNPLQIRLYFKDDVITYNNNIYVCLQENQVTTLSSIDTNYWKKVGNFDSIVGNGLTAYLSYDKGNDRILFSDGILSVVKSTVDSSLLTIKLKQATTGKIGVIFGSDIRNMDYSLLMDTTTNRPGSDPIHQYYNSGFYQKKIVGRVISNSGDTIEVGINQGAYLINLIAGNINNFKIFNPSDRDVFSPIVNMAFVAY